MAESRVIPSGRLYRQMFDAQVQLSLSLHQSRGERTAPETQTHTTNNRLLPTSAEQQLEEEVRGLPDVVVAERQSADVIERLRAKRERDHRETVKNLHRDLAVLGKDYEESSRSTCKDLLSCLEEMDQRLETLMGGMECQQPTSLQELNDVWKQVKETSVLKRGRICELDQNLNGYEIQRTQQIAHLLKKYCTLLERISSLNPCDLYRLLDAEAMMINTALLANRRSIARLRLHLLEGDLQKESVLHLRWQDISKTWKAGRVQQEIERFRELVSDKSVQDPDSVQEAVVEIRRTQQALSEEQRRLFQHICSLAPPTCTTALVTDWYNQLTALNQKIDGCHDNFVRQLQCSFDQSWQASLVEVERCKQALCGLELSEQEVKHIVSSQILPLMGPHQRRAEERVAILDRDVDVVARHAGILSRTVWNVLRGAALLWETHSRAMENREQQLEEQLRLLRCEQEEEIKRKEAHLDVLLDRLRQDSPEEALKKSLDVALAYLDEMPNSSREWYSKMDEVLESFPAVHVDELNTYSAAVSQYYHVGEVHTLTQEDLLSFYHRDNPDWKSIEKFGNFPISTLNELDHTQNPQDGLLKEAESSLAEIYISDTEVTFTTKRGGAYSGPAFELPVQNPLGSLGDEVQFILFPTETLNQSLIQLRTLSFDHLEQHFHDVLSSSAATVASRKKALDSEQELRLQLHKLRPQRIEMDIHNMRSAELHVHRECVLSQGAAVLQVLDVCRSDLSDLQTSTSASSLRFITSVSTMEERFHTATTSHTLKGFSSNLQDCLVQHIQETQLSQRAFRHSVQQRLEQVRDSNTKLVTSFRLFGEGGNFSPKEVDQLLRLLEKTSRRIDALEDGIQADMEKLEMACLEQVKGTVDRLQEKLSPLLLEISFSEKIQKVVSNVQVQIKAEAAHSNQQKMLISRQVEDLRRLTETAEVSQEKVFTSLSALGEELKKRYQYLDCNRDSSIESPAPQQTLQGSFAVAARPRSKLPRTPTRPTGELPLAAAAVSGASSEDITMGVLNKLRRLPQTSKNEKWVQMFGSDPDLVQNTRSFKLTVNSVLRTANEVLLQAAEDLYRKKEFDQWAERFIKRLLGYQEQAKQFNTTSIQEFGQQLCELEEVVRTLAPVMLGNHGKRQEEELMKAVEEFRTRMEETASATNHTQRKHSSQLKVRLGHPACKEELDALRRREEDRQSQYRSSINRIYEELQECMQARQEDVTASLSSLTESLVCQVDNLLTLELSEQLPTPDTEAGKDLLMPNSVQTANRIGAGLPISQSLADDTTASTVTMATEDKTLMTMANATSAVTMETSSSSQTTIEPCVDATATAGSVSSPIHQEILLHRDRALKRYEDVSKAESERFRMDRERLLIQLQRWTHHWQQQMNTLSTLKTE
ncbi:coiled-coil domain-containing protein 180 [Gadus chalcogrammus]|uniref:coiled-coil domain-containing protein 180 n=1 Tax=Gadus chalcogrammus TaxID=1042646 RepID=UPI0024C21A2F|nr:coiled-coil domain-containing protein 180 [Gadus chalcogrammus]